MVRSIGLLAVAVCPGLAAGVGRAEDPGVVRVMSFNIRFGTAKDGENHWEKRKAFLADTVKAFAPDLLGTQETLAFQRDYLAGRLAGTEAFGAGRDDGRDSGEMAALFYRTARFEKIDGGHFWLSETPDKPGVKGWDAQLPRVASWVKLKDRMAPEGKPVLFLNAHFDHKGRQARAESAKLIRLRLNELGKGCSLIVAGDFNAGEKSDPYRVLFGKVQDQESPVVDTFRVARPNQGPGEGSFNGFSPDATTGDRIDWIGASRDWRVLAADIDRTARDGRTPSDHFPVTAVLKR